MSAGYSIAAQIYLDNGWWPLPLPSGRKSPPPHGYTGRNGKAPTREDVARWCATNDGANIGLHLDATIVGIDVDDYGDKGGGATLAALIAEHGPLPATWSSTSRGLGPSRIYYFRIPEGVTFPGVFGEGIDVIQRHHRYAVVSPSTHPDTGEKYRWFDRNSIIATQPPHVDELAPLPQAWIEGLSTREYIAPPIPVQALRAPVLVEGDSIAERINKDHDWHTTLIADGWTLSKPGAQQSEWTRPGKNPAKGPSAVLHEPDGPFNVFTTAMAALQQKDADRNGTCWSYSMFGYLAATRHGGDRSALARDYRNDTNATDMQIRTMSSAGIARAVRRVESAKLHLGELKQQDAFVGHVRGDTEAVVHPVEHPLGRGDRDVELRRHVGDGERPAAQGSELKHPSLERLRERGAPVLKGFPSPPEHAGARRPEHRGGGERIATEPDDAEDGGERGDHQEDSAERATFRARGRKRLFVPRPEEGPPRTGCGGCGQSSDFVPEETAAGAHGVVAAEKPIDQTADPVRHHARAEQESDVPRPSEICDAVSDVLAARAAAHARGLRERMRTGLGIHFDAAGRTTLVGR